MDWQSAGAWVGATYHVVPIWMHEWMYVFSWMPGPGFPQQHTHCHWLALSAVLMLVYVQQLYTPFSNINELLISLLFGSSGGIIFAHIAHLNTTADTSLIETSLAIAHNKKPAQEWFKFKVPNLLQTPQISSQYHQSAIAYTRTSQIYGGSTLKPAELKNLCANVLVQDTKTHHASRVLDHSLRSSYAVLDTWMVWLIALSTALQFLYIYYKMNICNLSPICIWSFCSVPWTKENNDKHK